jgi:hypothetical protein
MRPLSDGAAVVAGWRHEARPVHCCNSHDMCKRVGVRRDQGAGRHESTSISPATLREKLANVLEPVLTLLYIVVLPLAFIALLCELCVFAPIQALVLVLMLLVPATGWLLRR